MIGFIFCWVEKEVLAEVRRRCTLLKCAQTACSRLIPHVLDAGRGGDGGMGICLRRELGMDQGECQQPSDRPDVAVLCQVEGLARDLSPQYRGMA